MFECLALLAQVIECLAATLGVVSSNPGGVTFDPLFLMHYSEARFAIPHNQSVRPRQGSNRVLEYLNEVRQQRTQRQVPQISDLLRHRHTHTIVNQASKIILSMMLQGR